MPKEKSITLTEAIGALLDEENRSGRQFAEAKAFFAKTTSRP